MKRSDTTVLNAASAGERSAFAALIARTATDVQALLPPDTNHYQTLYAIYTRAMRELHNGATPTDSDAWLRELAAQLSTFKARRKQTSEPSFATDRDLDRLWNDLAQRWPTGKKRYVRVNRKVALIVASILFAVGGMYAFVTWQIPRVETDALIATVYQPANGEQPLETVDDDQGTSVIPVIPLPPPSVDDPRPPQTTVPPDATEEPEDPVEPDDADEPDDEPQDDQGEAVPTN